MPSNGFCKGQRNDFKPTLVQTQVKRNDFKPTSCFGLDRWRPRFDGVMKCERKRREGSKKGEKFWLKYFEGSEKWFLREQQ